MSKNLTSFHLPQSLELHKLLMDSGKSRGCEKYFYSHFFYRLVTLLFFLLIRLGCCFLGNSFPGEQISGQLPFKHKDMRGQHVRDAGWVSKDVTRIPEQERLGSDTSSATARDPSLCPHPMDGSTGSTCPTEWWKLALETHGRKTSLQLLIHCWSSYDRSSALITHQEIKSHLQRKLLPTEPSTSPSTCTVSPSTPPSAALTSVCIGKVFMKVQKNQKRF